MVVGSVMKILKTQLEHTGQRSVKNFPIRKLCYPKDISDAFREIKKAANARGKSGFSGAPKPLNSCKRNERQ